MIRVPKLLLPIFLLLGCAGEADTASCDREPPLSYDSFGQSFMGKNCTGCHSSLLPSSHREGAPAGVDFDTYAGVLEWADRIEARSVGEGASMPPGGGPTEDERVLLAEWLECGVFPDVAALEAQ